MAILTSEYLEHQEIHWGIVRRISTVGGREHDRSKECGSELGQEKNCHAIEGREPFLWGEEERGIERVQCWVHTRRKPPWTMDWWNRKWGSQCFAKSVWCSNSEVLEMHNFCLNGACGMHSGGEGGHRPENEQSDVGMSWIGLGKNVALPGLHLEEGILPLQGQNSAGTSKSLQLAGDRGICIQWITWSLLFTVLQCRFHALHRCGQFFWDKGHQT